VREKYGKRKEHFHIKKTKAKRKRKRKEKISPNETKKYHTRLQSPS